MNIGHMASVTRPRERGFDGTCNNIASLFLFGRLKSASCRATLRNLCQGVSGSEFQSLPYFSTFDALSKNGARKFPQKPPERLS